MATQRTSRLYREIENELNRAYGTRTGQLVIRAASTALARYFGLEHMHPSSASEVVGATALPYWYVAARFVMGGQTEPQHVRHVLDADRLNQRMVAANYLASAVLAGMA
jgi:hypothetical protein